MGLCITSMAKTLTDNHTLDDRNHQWHHTTLLLSETLLSTAQASLCVCEVRSLEWTGSPCRESWSQISTYILTRYRLDKSLHLTTWGLCQPPLLKRIIGMAIAAFPWPTDQPQLRPAVVAAFTGLEPPDFYLCGYLKNRVYGKIPQTIPDLKTATTVAIRAIPREECRRVIENFARRIQMCLQRQGAHLEHIFLAPVKERGFVVQTWNFGDVCYTGLTWCSWSFVSN